LVVNGACGIDLYVTDYRTALYRGGTDPFWVIELPRVARRATMDKPLKQ
jgi:hypothetical protein